MKYFFTLVLISMTSFGLVLAQCLPGEVAISINIYTDSWGEEGYWEIVPTGAGCGNSTIAFGGDEFVGCSGISPDNLDGNWNYPDNAFITEGPFCVSIGDSIDLVYYDNYGDGGYAFEILENGIMNHVFIGGGYGNTWTFEAGLVTVPNGDSPCNALEVVPDGEELLLDNLGAIVGFNEPHPTSGPCNLFGFWCDSDPNISNTVWAYFVAEENTSYEFTTCQDSISFDTQIAVYRAADCQNFSTYELITSNDDMMGGCPNGNFYSSTCYASCLEAGNTYYIQLDGWQGSVGQTFLSINTFEGENFGVFFNNINCPIDKGATPTGSIEPFIIGSGSDFTSEWTGPDNYTSSENAIYNLSPGVYNLSLVSACGNIYQEEFDISIPQEWYLTSEVNPPSCPLSANGTIDISVAGATPDYDFSWSGEQGVISIQEDVDNLMGGTNTLTITDSHGCQLITTYELTPENDFVFELIGDSLLCIDENVFVTGPAGSTYLWQDGSINQYYQINGEDWPTDELHSLVLTATTPDGCSHSEVFLFEVEDCSAVVTNINASFQLFPNPFKDHINIGWGGSDPFVQMRIWDAFGRLVLENSNATKGVFFVNDLPQGIYSLELTNSNLQVQTTIIKSE